MDALEWPPRYSRHGVLRRIGGGVYGNVYAAVGDSVAYKLSDDSATSARELQILSRIEHPNVIEVLGCGMATPEQQAVYRDATAWFATSRADADLYQILSGRMTLHSADARFGHDVAVQLCCAVAAVHNAGALHRDIKPGNVLLYGRGAEVPPHVCLCDFGLARCALSHAGTKRTADGCDAGLTGSVQTIWYRSPEVSVRAQYDYAADIWSVGLVLYELFARQASGTSRPLLQANSDAGGCCDQAVGALLRRSTIDRAVASVAAGLNPQGLIGTAVRVGVFDERSEKRARDAATSPELSREQRTTAAMLCAAIVSARDIRGAPSPTRFERALSVLDAPERDAVLACLHALPADRPSARALCLALCERRQLSRDVVLPGPPADRRDPCPHAHCPRCELFRATHYANGEAGRRAQQRVVLGPAS